MAARAAGGKREGEPKRRTAGGAQADAQKRADPVAQPYAFAATYREATVHEAKTHLSRLLSAVEAGETVVITRRGKPVAKLEAMEERKRGKRVPGSMKGLIDIDESFFEPLPEDLLRAWEGD